MSSPFSTPPRQPILPVDDPTEAWERVRSHQAFIDPPLLLGVEDPATSAVVPPPPGLDHNDDDDRDDARARPKRWTSDIPERSRREEAHAYDDYHDDDRRRRVLRIACISDTHGRHRSVRVPPCDVLIHGGDFTNVGEPETIVDVADYFDELRRNGTVRTAIICIAGNHELTFETDRYDKVWHRFRLPGQVDKFDVRDARSRLERSCTYLEDSTTRIGTITFYGSPYQPEFGGWAFNVPRGDIDELWERIPSDVDVLITHGPPLGRGDVTSGNHRVGCVSLMKHVRDRLRPRLHVFGHVHEGYGVYHDGTTAYVNASSVRTSSTTNRPGKGGEDDGGGGAINPCVVFDLPYDRRLPALLVQPAAFGTEDDVSPPASSPRPASHATYASHEEGRRAPSLDNDDAEKRPRSDEVEGDVDPSPNGGGNKRRRRHCTSEEVAK